MVRDMALYGKILRIFDETTLLVNIGVKDGVKRGDRLVVIEKMGEVKDPDSDESLGELELIKAELVATDVQEKISILKTEPGRTPSKSLPLSARMVQDSVRADGTQYRMSVAPGEMSGIPAPSPVKVGDIVRLVG